MYIPYNIYTLLIYTLLVFTINSDTHRFTWRRRDFGSSHADCRPSLASQRVSRTLYNFNRSKTETSFPHFSIVPSFFHLVNNHAGVPARNIWVEWKNINLNSHRRRHFEFGWYQKQYSSWVLELHTVSILILCPTCGMLN